MGLHAAFLCCVIQGDAHNEKPLLNAEHDFRITLTEPARDRKCSAPVQRKKLLSFCILF